MTYGIRARPLTTCTWFQDYVKLMTYGIVTPDNKTSVAFQDYVKLMTYGIGIFLSLFNIDIDR